MCRWLVAAKMGMPIHTGILLSKVTEDRVMIRQAGVQPQTALVGIGGRTNISTKIDRA